MKSDIPSYITAVAIKMLVIFAQFKYYNKIQLRGFREVQMT